MISLPAALQSVFQVGGVTVETDASAAVTAINVDYVNKIIVMIVNQGTVTGQSFTLGQYPAAYQFTINMVTGVWSISGTNLKGTFTAPSIAAISAIFLPLRNSGETFVGQVNLFPAATVVAWTQI